MIVVDGKGMTVYEFGKDVQGSGASSCSGQCATAWPAVPAGTSTPTLKGVTGTVGTIKGVDGKPQLTLNGSPLYYYAGDKAAGQTSGQGVGNIWWVVSPAGAPIGK
jgi:predicted lipoprotein with Yx(FWY)xxD motif